MDKRERGVVPAGGKHIYIFFLNIIININKLDKVFCNVKTLFEAFCAFLDTH